ncbi:MAG: hypothetical protein CVV25_05750 [Ignavibacteriae bacterium HGW-Ignavibacteriae-4]|jgi:hypothetical protein|nr:MAG: hypothetical protein CVV25_05750 [Ignavibacteriae bacterium HGW-Ignavibacteriae-4]
MKVSKLTLILFLIINLPLISQWLNYNTGNSDIPDNLVYRLALDSKNNIWMSTFEGLAKYDGSSEWLIYDTLNSDIPTNDICALAVDENDLLWSGSGLGYIAFSFDGVKWKLYENEEGQVSHSCASDIEFDYENRPWFATSRFAKYLVNDNWIEVPHAPDIAGFSDVNCVEMDKKDEIWLGTETEGLVSFYNSKLTYYSTKNSDIPSNRIASLAVDSLNNLWLGTKDSRIAKFNKLKDEWTVFDIEKTTLDGTIAQIRVDEKGDIWATAGLSLLHFDGVVWDTLNLDADTSGGAGPYVITDFLFNKFGNIWAITDNGDGLYKYTRNPETSVEESYSEFINVYPNPSKDNITIEIDESIIVNGFQIIDIEGKSVMERNNLQSAPFLIDLKTLHTGSYFIDLKTIDGMTFRKKIVKE